MMFLVVLVSFLSDQNRIKFWICFGVEENRMWAAKAKIPSKHRISRDQKFRWQILDIKYLPLSKTLFSISSSSNLRYSTEVESVIFVAIIFSSVQEGSWWLNFRPWVRVIYERGIENCSCAAHKAVRLIWKQDLVTISTFTIFQILQTIWPYKVSIPKIISGKNYV